MYKIFTSLVAFFCCLSFVKTSTAQISFSIVPIEQQADVQVGDTVTVNVDVTNFNDIAAYKFSINWNVGTGLDFEAVHNFNLPGLTGGPGSFGLNSVGSGVITTLYQAPMGGEYTSPDTTIFSIDFIIMNAAAITTPIQITSNPSPKEVIGLNGMGALDDLTSVTTFNDGTATILLPNAPPSCTFGGGFGQIMESDSAETGNQVCLSVYSCGFTDIVSAQYSINFDPALLQYTSTGNYNLPGLTSGFFNANNSVGWITFSWIDSLGTGTTIPDGTAIYDVCFTVVGAGGLVADVDFTGNPSNIEVTDVNSNGASIPFASESGEVTITGNSGSAVTVVGSNEIGENGTQACVQVTALNFDSIAGIQYDMHWDTSIIKYASIGNFAPFLNSGFFNVTPAFTDAGTIVLSFNPSFPVSVGNGDTLYQVCFDIVGDPGEVSPFTFDGVPLAIEVIQVQDGVDTQVPLVAQDGEVEVDIVGTGGIVNITASDKDVCPGDTVCVDYRAINFEGIVSIEYVMTYDPAVLLYIPPPTISPVELSNANIILNGPGNLIMSWVETNVDPVTYVGDTLLYSLCFEAIGADGTNSTMAWDLNETIEIGDFNGMELPYVLNDGTVSITNNACAGMQPPDAPTAVIIDVDCFGDNTGELNITVTGGTPPYTYAWTASNGGSGHNATSEDQTDLTAGTYTVTVTDATPLTSTASFVVAQPTAALATTITPVDATCDGGSDGSATANPAGGTSPYTYQWNVSGANTPTITNLPAGQVCVTITDANDCTTNTCVNIGEGPAISIDITVTNSACNIPSGSLAASASGGSGSGYTYVWNTTPQQTNATANNLPPGNFCVTTTDGAGCTEVECANVGTLAGPDVTIANDVVSCVGSSDGSLTAVTTDGTPPYTYQWSEPDETDPIISGLPAGVYLVTVTDNAGCSSVENGTVSDPDPVIADASVTSDYNGEDISCDGGNDGTATVTPGGGTGPYTFAWDNGAGTNQNATGLSAITYTVTVTDNNGCTMTDQVTLTDPSAITLSAAITNEDNGGDGAVNLTVSGGIGNYTYIWDPSSATSQDIAGLTCDDYCVTVTDENNCTATNCFTVNCPNALVVTLVSTSDESCYLSKDGTIEITQNGTGPWGYSWSDSDFNASLNNPTNVGQGTYSVTVTDNGGVTGVLSGIAVGGPQDPISNLLIQKTNVDCNGASTGSITISVSGGNGPTYTVDWGGQTGTAITALSAGTYTPTITDSRGCTHIGVPIVVDEPDMLQVVLGSTVNPGCNGELDGEIHITVSDGTPPYSYSWMMGSTPVGGNSPDLTGQGPGSYTCVITDDVGCVAMTGQIDLVQIASPEITLVSSSNLLCADDLTGKIDISVAGGAGPYTFLWSPGGQTTEDVSGLPIGTYSVTVTDSNGCTDTEGPITLTQPDPISLSTLFVTPATSAGNDGAIDMNEPTGGTAPYTYLWSNGAVTLDVGGLSSESYSLTVTDANGCTGEIAVSVAGSLDISPFEVTDVSCAGNEDGAVDITVFGGTPPYQFLWDTPGAGTITEDLFDIPAGTYCVTVTDADGLTTSQCFDVGEPDLMVISNLNVVHETGNGCNGSINITISGGTVPYTYLWSNGATSQDLDMLCKGDYQVSITDANGCMVISGPISVLPPPISIVNFDAEMVSCAGNSDGQYCISVFGGCPPYNFSLSNGDMENSIDGQNVCFDDLTAGDYMLTISDSDGSTNTPEIVQSFTITMPPLIEVSVVNIINNTGGDVCNGAINIGVEGGAGGPYAYQWSNGETSEDIDMLCAVNNPYSVTVTDANGCIGVLEGIEVFDAPLVTSEMGNVSCIDDCDGSINIFVEFGTQPYSYLWDTGEATPNRSSLCPGPYTVTVTDDNGITSVKTFTVQAPSSALLVTTVSTTMPNGDNSDGAINIGVTGGWGGYEYLWSNGATSMDLGGIIEGDYTVTVTDAGGCEFIHQVERIDANRISLVSSEIEEEDCADNANGFICIETEGGVLPHTYRWNVTGIPNDNACIFDVGAGAYSCTVTDASGALIEVFDFNLTGRDSMRVRFTTAPGSATAIVTGGDAPYEYVWNNDRMDATPTIVDQPTNTYFVVATDVNGCLVTGSVDITEDIDDDCTEARTILTPNGDFKNETFEILCARVFDIDLQVFNRWGELVFEATNYDNTWNGTDSAGNPLIEGGYYYVISFTDQDGADKQAKGYLTILND